MFTSQPLKSALGLLVHVRYDSDEVRNNDRPRERARKHQADTHEVLNLILCWPAEHAVAHTLRTTI